MPVEEQRARVAKNQKRCEESAELTMSHFCRHVYQHFQMVNVSTAFSYHRTRLFLNECHWVESMVSRLALPSSLVNTLTLPRGHLLFFFSCSGSGPVLAVVSTCFNHRNRIAGSSWRLLPSTATSRSRPLAVRFVRRTVPPVQGQLKGSSQAATSRRSEGLRL